MWQSDERHKVWHYVLVAGRAKVLYFTCEMVVQKYL
jgi:hypothetical protein